MPRDVAQSSTPPTSAPDCDRKASLPGVGFAMPKLALTPSAGTHMPQAVRADDAQARWPRRIEHRLLEVAVKPGGDDDRRGRALLSELRDQGRDGVGRRGDDRKIWRFGKGIDAGKAVPAGNPPMFGVDQIDRPGKAAVEDILGERLAHRAFIVARPDHRDRTRAQGIFKIADGHWRRGLEP